MTPQELADAWVAAWAGRDGDAFDPLCQADVHYEDPLTPDPLQGAGAIARHAARLWRALPDAHLGPTASCLSDGRYLAIPCRLTGTQTEALGDLPASDRFVVAHLVFYCETADGTLLRVRAFFDSYDVARQLGILPARGTLGERALLALRGFGLRLGDL